MEMFTLNHIMMYKLSVLDWNTWNHMTVCKQIIIIKRNSYFET